MTCDVKLELESIKDVEYISRDSITEVLFKGLKIFDLDNKTGNITYAYISNIKDLDIEDETQFMDIFQKFVGWI